VGVTTARIENQHHQQGQHGHHQGGQGQHSAGAVKVGGWRYEDASRYIGEWNQRGQKHGIGHLQFADGTRYDGQFQEGLSQGVGCLWFADGAKLVRIIVRMQTFRKYFGHLIYSNPTILFYSALWDYTKNLMILNDLYKFR